MSTFYWTPTGGKVTRTEGIGWGQRGGIRVEIDRARQAQQVHRQRHDVQLELFNLPLDFDPEGDKLDSETDRKDLYG